MSTRKRNAICVTIIMIGLLNFVGYTVGYGVLGGDAHNGGTNVTVKIDAEDTNYRFAVRGHHLRSLEGEFTEVTQTQWIYSYIHSILVLITSTAVIISMLVLARPHIVATMRDGVINGRTLVITFMTIVIVIGSLVTFVFTRAFILKLIAA